MASRGRRYSKKEDTRKIIRLEDYTDREEEAAVEYDEDGEEESLEEEVRKARVPKAVYRVALILIALVVVLAVWLNREWLTPSNLANWVKVQFMGAGEGEGYPVSITGTRVSALNFTGSGGDVLVLSNTALDRLDSSGKQLLTLSHGLSSPVLRSASGKTLLYNQGGTGYLVLSGTQTVINDTASGGILAGAIAGNGRFALGLQSEDGASELKVFLEDGSLQYRYLFSQGYITAVALSYDGTHGLACTVRSEQGRLISGVTVLDFSKEDPQAVFEAEGGIIVDAAWTDGGDLYAVSDTALYIARANDPDFETYSYGGRYLTAYSLSQGRAFVSLSPYEHGGSSTLLTFHGSGEPNQIVFESRIVALSASGSTVGALLGGEAVFCDYTTGLVTGTADAGSDAKSIALSSERAAYVLGVSEVRRVQIE